MNPSPELIDFLGEVFSVSELRQFLSRFDAKVLHDLPGEQTPPAEFFAAAVAVLGRRGLVDHEFFDALIRERSRFKDRINRLRARCMVHGELRPDALWRGGELRLLEEIKVGGFAEVWRGIETGTERKVAIKVLKRERLDEAVSRKRFLRGAQVLADHPHENLVRVYSREEREGGRLYFVMELLEGGNLEARVVEGVSADVALGYVLQVARALHHLHAKGYVHRDVKPSNVMLDGKGVAKLIDLDLVDADAGAFVDLTDAPIGGTRRFAPPEAFHPAGNRPNEPDPAFDVYSLAQLVVFVLSRGALPDEGRPGEVPSACGEDERRVLREALYHDPTARTPSVEVFWAQLRKARPGLEPLTSGVYAPLPVEPPSVSWRIRWRRLLERLRRWLWWILGASLGFSLAVVGLYNLLRPPQLLDERSYRSSGAYAPVEGCVRLEVKAWGGGGGGTIHPGGGGGYVGASFMLEDRNSFEFDVGGGGGSWRVGGSGQPGGAESGSGYFHGARAGGYSAVRKGARVFVIAGGGGGAGGAGAGGGGGGDEGESGKPQDRGGRGGSQVEGGKGGGHNGDGEDGHPGARSLGGLGGRANPERGGGGGGGGGGHFGGGGGGADNLYMVSGSGSGGGGGGSGWYDPQAVVPGSGVLLTAHGPTPANSGDMDYEAPGGQGGCCTGSTGQQVPSASGESGLVVFKCWDKP